MEGAIITAWVGGLLIGSFIVLHFWVVGRAAGCSTGYACVVDKLNKNGNLFGKIDPLKMFFIIGLPIGGLLHSTIFQGSIEVSYAMGVYDAILPDDTLTKTLILFVGGILLGFGARLAGGCTTGHALVGGALLNWSSILAAVLFFAFATMTTWIIFSVLN